MMRYMRVLGPTRWDLALGVGLLLSACAERGRIDELPTEMVEPSLRGCTVGSVVHGIDVSEWQGSILWREVAKEGNEFAFIRVSDGTAHPDATFSNNWSEARAAGLVRGAYQHFRPGQDAVAQARLMIDMVGGLEVDDLPPALDVEADDGLSPSEVSDRIEQWLGEVESALGVKPIVYSGKSFWEENVGSADFDDHPLWLPSWYPSFQGNCPSTPVPWSNWRFWQWTSSGQVAGISGDVDRDIFNGTLDELRALAQGSAAGDGAGISPRAPETACGDAVCSDPETTATCPADCSGALHFMRPQDGGQIPNPVIFSVGASSNIQRVQYVADDRWKIGESTNAKEQFVFVYTFLTLGSRSISAEGFDARGVKIARSVLPIVVKDDGATGSTDPDGSGAGGSALQQLALQRMAGIAPQNRPYVFNGVGDCYGFVRQVWNAILSDNKPHEEDFFPKPYNKTRWILTGSRYLPVNDYPSSKWIRIADLDALLPGDVLATHQGHTWGGSWHGGLYNGKRNGTHYVLDNSRRAGANGAYVRNFYTGFKYYYQPVHDRLAQGQ